MLKISASKPFGPVLVVPIIKGGFEYCIMELALLWSTVPPFLMPLTGDKLAYIAMLLLVPALC